MRGGKLRVDEIQPGAVRQPAGAFGHLFGPAIASRRTRRSHRSHAELHQVLFLPIERKSVEPMAARLAPANVRQMHQSLHHIVAEATVWSDAAWLREVRRQVLPAMTRKHPLSAWIVDDTGFPKKGTHSVGVYGYSTAGNWASRKTAGWRSACRWPPSRPSLPKSPTSCTCRRAGRKSGHDEAGPEYREEIRFQTKPEIALDQIRGLVEEEVPRAPCWPMPPMATTPDSATGCNN